MIQLVANGLTQHRHLSFGVFTHGFGWMYGFMPVFYRIESFPAVITMTCMTSSTTVPNQDALATMATDLTGTSDRAAVITAAAHIDAALTDALVCRMAEPREKEKDELFDPGKPIGDLGAKIDLARRMSIIDEDFAEALHCVRRIRNEYAHVWLMGHLSAGKQGKAFSRLVKLVNETEPVGIGFGMVEATRAAFLSAAFHLAAKLIPLKNRSLVGVVPKPMPLRALPFDEGFLKQTAHEAKLTPPPSQSAAGSP
jgi:hypothetical protein